MDNNIRLEKAKRSLNGLSVGDAFGELFFFISPFTTTNAHLPAGPWKWTDDTHMALSILDILQTEEQIIPDALAQAFAKRYQDEPQRGYAGGAAQLLSQISEGGDWRKLSPLLFGSGSYGNGAAMRAAPIGAYFWDDLSMAAEQARLSAIITHAHNEGQAGAIAVAVAAAIAAAENGPRGKDFLEATLPYIPDGITKERIQQAMQIQPEALLEAIDTLGTGRQVSAQDTVPFCLWVAAYHLNSFEQALWTTVKGQGDCDTTSAIVGGIVALSTLEIPTLWLERREALPLINGRSWSAANST